MAAAPEMTDAAALLEAGDHARAELAELIDRQLDPLGRAAMDALAPDPGQTVIDIGCGAGQTLVQLAERVGPAGRVIGVDVAPGVLAVARRRTAHRANIGLRRADAATIDLLDQYADALYSRFGVMAFADPARAFRNLRRMTRTGGRIAFVCWRSLAENELDALPIRAAGIGIAADPAPFSFEQADSVTDVLHSAGFGAVTVNAFDAQVSCGGIDETLAVLTGVGALGKILRDRPDLKPQAREQVRAALPAPAADGLIWLGAASWIVTAVAG
jgi:SAM-dependent methyltransferase